MTKCPNDGAALVEEDQDPLIGKVLNSYRISEVIGIGGMARVYRAEHTFFDRVYAVKVMRRHIAANPTLVERFRREALVISKISHPNVVDVTDFGVSPEGLAFLVMEWIEGRTLGELLLEQAPFPEERAAHIARQIATALASAHYQSIIHRDLKPGNIMVISDEKSRTETVKILDFGLARIADEAKSKEGKQLTRVGQLLGTPHYIAPELLRGMAASDASDLYALGVVIYGMLVGKHPFPGKRFVDIVRAQKRQRPIPPPQGKGLGKLALSLLEWEVDRRPASAQAVIASIDALGLEPWVLPKVETLRSLASPFAEGGAEAEVPDGEAAPATKSYPTNWVEGEEEPAPTLLQPEPGSVVADEPPKLLTITQSDAEMVTDPSTDSKRDSVEIELSSDAFIATEPGTKILGEEEKKEEKPTVIATSVSSHGISRSSGSMQPFAPPHHPSKLPLYAAATAVLATGLGLVAMVLLRSPNPEEPPPVIAQPEQPPVVVPGNVEPIQDPIVVPVPKKTKKVKRLTTSPGPRKGKKKPRLMPRRTEPKVSLSQLDRKLIQAIRKRGLSKGDLRQLDTTSEATRQYAAARKSKNTTKAQSALNALLPLVEQVQIEAPMLKRKLKKISSLLSKKPRNIPQKALHSLETRYFDLATAVKPGLPEREYIDLSQQITKLHSDVNKAVNNGR